MEPILEIRSLGKYRRNSWALRDIDLSVYPGEFTLVLGENGAGKTTLLRTLAGLLRPDKGEVVFTDTNLSPQRSRGRISFCSVDSFLYQELSVYENLLLFSRLSGMAAEKVDILLEKFEISKFSNHLVAELSSGTRKKAALVRTFLSKPDVLLFDEALNYLDTKGKQQLLELIKDRLKSGVAVVFSTNRATELLGESNQIASLVGGRLMSLEKDVLTGRAVH